METTSVMRLSAADFTAFKIIGHVENKFIVCKMDRFDKNRLILLIDQHAADERVRLERYWSEMVNHGLAQTTDCVLQPVPLRPRLNMQINQRIRMTVNQPRNNRQSG